MMKTKYESILENAHQKHLHFLPLIDENPWKYCDLALQALLEDYNELKTIFEKQKYSIEEEKYFFKHVKPKVFSKLLVVKEIKYIELNKPMVLEKSIKKYYHWQLRKKEKFLGRNAQLYQYLKNEETYLDGIYFVRTPVKHLENDSKTKVPFDPFFSTTHDYLVAKLFAAESILKYLLDKIIPLHQTNSKEKVLTWTGSKASLVELIYALHTEGVFNHGACELRDIMQTFGQIFQVEVAQYHRTFHEIINRKTDRTKFLNSLKEHLIHRMDTMDSLILSSILHTYVFILLL